MRSHGRVRAEIPNRRTPRVVLVVVVLLLLVPLTRRFSEANFSPKSLLSFFAPKNLLRKQVQAKSSLHEAKSKPLCFHFEAIFEAF